MREQKSKMIGETKYLVTQMDGLRALKAQTTLIKILGPAIASLVTGSKIDIQTIKAKLFSELPDILRQFDNELVNDFVISLFEHDAFKADKNGHPEKVDFGQEFAGRINDMWRVALFILEVNFYAGKSLESILPTTAEAENLDTQS